MRLSDGTHLTYCTNIHPGETWQDIDVSLRRHVPAIKRAVSPTKPFGLGLRLSAAAAATLGKAEPLARFREWLQREDLYVFTLNGFPYGTFHGRPVKDSVYRPDWRSPERAQYTRRLAEILCELLPPGMDGSISTVPGAYKDHLTDAGDPGLIAANLVAVAVDLHRLRQRTGQRITLALEPEPDCLLETTAETVAFFSGELFGSAAVALAGRLAGLAPGDAEALLRHHLGLCLDACHSAVAFEEPTTMLDNVRAAGIPVYKLQLSAGLRVVEPRALERAALAAFAEDVYLHQTRARSGERIRRFPDLPDALADSESADEWRIHYHVPLWAERLETFTTTAAWLEELLREHRRAPVATHLEVETYTWSVLPEQHRSLPVADAIARELQWVIGKLA